MARKVTKATLSAMFRKGAAYPVHDACGLAMEVIYGALSPGSLKASGHTANAAHLRNLAWRLNGIADTEADIARRLHEAGND